MWEGSATVRVAARDRSRTRSLCQCLSASEAREKLPGKAGIRLTWVSAVRQAGTGFPITWDEVFRSERTLLRLALLAEVHRLGRRTALTLPLVPPPQKN